MNDQQPSSEVHPQPDSIFKEVYDLEPYEKSMKNARIWLYVIAGLQLVMGFVEYNTVEDRTIAGIAFGIDAALALAFLGLALWSRKKPVVAFTIALAFYIVVVLGLALLSGDFSTLAKGIIFKVLITVALVKANRDARKYEEIKASIGEPIN